MSSANGIPAFVPLSWSLKEIRAAIPARLFVRETHRGLLYLGRDISLAVSLWWYATKIDSTFRNFSGIVPGHVLLEILRWGAWCLYWWFQGLVFTGLWVIGHECGHGAFSDYRLLNDVIGFALHTFLWTPYFSWKISHHRHHSNHASIERDEVYVPKTRSDLGLPKEGDPHLDYDDVLGDTPIYTLFMLVRQQLLAFPAYLLYNVSGQKSYPKWTNHFDPNSILFTSSQRNAVILSNVGIACMVWAVSLCVDRWGAWNVIKYYLIPWLEVTHWFVLITYLHHTDPIIPHYRSKAWSFPRGAAATVDRPALGWQGRFFLHDVAHFHVVHHFFPRMPFYHGEEATRYLKGFLGDHYVSSDKPIFQALWSNYNDCQFVEDEGDVVFYRDRKGRASRQPAACIVSLESRSTMS